ncbi:hypothetical protein [Halorubrum trueperi]|uniref:PH domain-containing protein n=1 Tax=Halorubrum trueperi TaxID=2004704 RepID=A0ABD5UKV0_9EURY
MGHVWNTVLAIVVASLIVPAGILTIDYGLRYGGIEYRVSDEGNAIVAYDRLFRTRLWRIEPWDETGLRVEQKPIRRWIDTSRVVGHSDREIRLPHLRYPESILNVFNRRASNV